MAQLSDASCSNAKNSIYVEIFHHSLLVQILTTDTKLLCISLAHPLAGLCKGHSALRRLVRKLNHQIFNDMNVIPKEKSRDKKHVSHFIFLATTNESQHEQQ